MPERINSYLPRIEGPPRYYSADGIDSGSDEPVDQPVETTGTTDQTSELDDDGEPEVITLTPEPGAACPYEGITLVTAEDEIKYEGGSIAAGDDPVPEVLDSAPIELKQAWRRKYMHEEGFSFTTDAGHRFMDSVEQGLKPQNIEWSKMYPLLADDPAATALAIIGFDVYSRVDRLSYDERTRRESSVFTLSEDDIRDPAIKFAFADGLADLAFPFHFVPAVAVAIRDDFWANGHITAEQSCSMSPRDWADLLRTGWFSDVMHDLALTANSIYGRFGSEAQDYQLGALRKYLRGKIHHEYGKSIFATSETRRGVGTRELTAKLNPEVRVDLRRKMRDQGSPGCPVARHAGAVSMKLAQSDLHIQRMIDNKNLAIANEVTRNGRVRFSHQRTPIDRSMLLLADYLDRYEIAFGTPSIETARVERTPVYHRHVPKVGMFESVPI